MFSNRACCAELAAKQPSPQGMQISAARSTLLPSGHSSRLTPMLATLHMTALGAPIGRYLHAAVYDSTGDRMLVYGGLLVCMMIFRPNGLMGTVSFTNLVLRALGRKPHLKIVMEQKILETSRSGNGDT